MKIKQKYALLSLMAAVMLNLASCGNAENMLTIDGKKYAVSIGDIEDLATMTGIKITGDDIVRKFNENAGRQAPAWMTVTVNGKTTEATGHVSTKEYVMFVFDGLTVQPDEITVYSTADKESRLNFDGKTKAVKK